MDIENEILNLQFSVARLQSLLELTMQRSAEAGIILSRADVELANERALAMVQAKYPDRPIGENEIDLTKFN